MWPVILRKMELVSRRSESPVGSQRGERRERRERCERCERCERRERCEPPM
jgi:hypothetical protein